MNHYDTLHLVWISSSHTHPFLRLSGGGLRSRVVHEFYEGHMLTFTCKIIITFYLGLFHDIPSHIHSYVGLVSLAFRHE